MSQRVEQIANRHVARCLSRIEEVFELPEIVADVIRKEMHFCAQDVETAIPQHGGQDDDRDTRFNR